MTLPESAPALVATRPGGTDVLTVSDIALEPPGPSQVMVKVAAAGVNFIDVYQRQGIYPTPTPFVLGNEGAGEVVAVGEGVTEIVVGDRVAWAMTLGSARAYAVIPAAATVPVPPTVDLETAAAAMLQGMTAHYLVTSTYPVSASTVALVHAAAGGVGRLLVQLLKDRGATVVATAGSKEKVRAVRELGADVVIDYSTSTDLAAAVRAATDGLGVHVAYDGVGKATFDASLASLRPRGLLALFGGASGQVPPLDLQRLNTAGSVFLTRPSLGHYLATREELLTRGGDILDAIAEGRLRIHIGGRYPLAEAAAAYDALESRATQGKLLLLP